jgi:phenylpropionate dioxygenase-like ring-hydroxylating dioxygenase large terminal subunit
MLAPYENELALYRLEELSLSAASRCACAGQLEECHGQLFGRHAHSRGASRPDPPVRPELRRRSAALGGQDVGQSARRALHRSLRSACTKPCCRMCRTCPIERQRLWTYFKLWPNVAFDIYPDQIDFMQMIPVSPTDPHPGDRLRASGRAREMRAARYLLNWRINRRVSLEDKALIERVQHGMGSRSYFAGAAGTQRGGAAQFRAPHARIHSGKQAGTGARRGMARALELWPLRVADSWRATSSSSAADTTAWCAPPIWRRPGSR